MTNYQFHRFDVYSCTCMCRKNTLKKHRYTLPIMIFRTKFVVGIKKITPTNILIWMCCFIMLITCTQVITQESIVILPQGRIAGIKDYRRGALEPVETFLGVPYAMPPVGRHRFSAPERHTGWKGTLNAHHMPPHCPQLGDAENNNFSEDCLYLNIWTTRRADGKSLPVLVIFYSESWLAGGVTLLCQELANEGIVVVTVSYRLHLLAFFTMKSVSARGNLALLDQYMALLWVRSNIGTFGGDPAAITLAGHSAGADSVLYHITSPRGIGLFQRAIVMSPQNVWKIIDERKNGNATAIETLSWEITRTLGCGSNSEQEALQCMRDRPLSDIIALYSNTNWSKELQPISDDFLPKSEQYLPTSLAVSLSASKQPMQLDLLLGATDLEAINYNDENYGEIIKEGGARIADYVTNKAIPDLLPLFSLHGSEAISLLTQAIRWEYWGAMTKKDIMSNTFKAIENLARMESSAKWGAGNALLAARLARRVSRLYVYRYKQPATVDLRGRQINFTGAVHGSDLLSLLGDELILQVARRHTTPEEKRTSSVFRRYVTNFIKYGSPGTEDEWKRYKVGEAQIHDIYLKNINDANIHSSSRDISFWLQYLPQLSNLHLLSEHTEHLTSEKDESRLRGGVFAMCGVSAVLLILLCASVIVLRRERTRRSYNAEEMHH